MKNNKRFKIAQLLPSFNSGGVERGVLELSNQLSDIFDIFIISKGGRLVSQLDKNKVNKNQLNHIELNVKSKNPIIIFINIFKLIYLIKKYNINIIHVRSRAPAFSAKIACYFTKIYLISSFHGTYSLNLLFKNKISKIKKIYNSIMLKADHIIAVSPFIKDHIIKYYGKKYEKKISIINRSFDEKIFNDNNINLKEISVIKNNLSLNNEFIILSSARISKWKGHELLIDSIFKLDKDINNFKLIIIGDNKDNYKYYKYLLEKTRNLNLQNKIIFLDHVTDIYNYYYLADLVICPSIREEAFGRVVIEAGAIGKIVIASDIGGHRYSILNNKTGFLFKNNNSDDLYSKIKYVINMDIKEKDYMIYNAKEYINNHFTNKVFFQKNIELYNKILKI